MGSFFRINLLVGLESSESDWLAKYEQKAKDIREKTKGAVKEGETVVIINVREKKISLLGDNYGRGGEVIYNMLKLNLHYDPISILGQADSIADMLTKK